MSFKLCSYKLLTVNSIVVFYDFFFHKMGWGGAGRGWDFKILFMPSMGLGYLPRLGFGTSMRNHKKI